MAQPRSKPLGGGTAGVRGGSSSQGQRDHEAGSEAELGSTAASGRVVERSEVLD